MTSFPCTTGAVGLVPLVQLGWYHWCSWVQLGCWDYFLLLQTSHHAMFVGLTDDDSDLDMDDDDSFTISTPSEGELESMSPVGTLRPDGKLEPPAGRRTNTPDERPNSTDDDDLFFPPMLALAAKSNPIPAQHHSIGANGIMSHTDGPIRNSDRLQSITNPAYSRVVLGDDCITGSSHLSADSLPYVTSFNGGKYGDCQPAPSTPHSLSLPSSISSKIPPRILLSDV